MKLTQCCCLCVTSLHSDRLVLNSNCYPNSYTFTLPTQCMQSSIQPLFSLYLSFSHHNNQCVNYQSGYTFIFHLYSCSTYIISLTVWLWLVAWFQQQKPIQTAHRSVQIQYLFQLYCFKKHLYYIFCLFLFCFSAIWFLFFCLSLLFLMSSFSTGLSGNLQTKWRTILNETIDQFEGEKKVGLLLQLPAPQTGNRTALSGQSYRRSLFVLRYLNGGLLRFAHTGCCHLLKTNLSNKLGFNIISKSS